MEEIDRWVIPSLNLTLNKGDLFKVNGVRRKLTSILTASDQLGVYACYPHFDDEMMLIVEFVNKYKSGEIVSVIEQREDKLENILK